MNNEFKRMQKLAGLITECACESNMNEEAGTNLSTIASKVFNDIKDKDTDSGDRMKLINMRYKQKYNLSDEDVKELHAKVGDMLKSENGDIEEGLGAYEYEEGKAAGEKMSKFKLREKIREMVLAEMDGAAVEAEDYNPVNEGMDDPNVKEIIQMLKDMEVDGETMEYILRQVGMEDQMADQLVHNRAGLGEAKKKDKAEDAPSEEPVDDTEDINIDMEEPSMFGGDDDAERILDLLNQLQDEAEKIGDEKLLKQIGNTITFFTCQHVSEKPELNEASFEALDRMDGLVSNRYLDLFMDGVQGIIKDLKEEGFEEDDIYDFLMDKIKTLG